MRFKGVLAGIAILGLSAGAASAADIAPYQPPMAAVAPAAPSYNWTGFYIGVNGGYGWGEFPNNAAAVLGFPVDLGDAGGGLVGGTLGYNWQFGHVVAGLETDIDWANISDTDPAAVTGTKATLSYLGTVRARLGYAFDRALLYATGGFAYGGGTVKSFTPPVGSADQTTVGWTVGAGIEYAIWHNLSAKIEYRYTDLGKATIRLPAPAPAFKGGYRGSQVIAGINYRFW
jgi:outer membrane immunogenic protein